MPNELFDDGRFQLELANFLSHPNTVGSDLSLPSPAHPQYIQTLFNGILQSAGCTPDPPLVTGCATGILRGIGPPPDVPGITKHVRDLADPSDYGAKFEWRRSPLWLFIRVTIQMVANRSLARASCKRFVLFFMCTLAQDGNNANISSDLLHLMSSKILRRLCKLGASTPDWLSEMVMKTSTSLRKTLDARRKQLNVGPSLFRNPSQDELIRDTELLLLNSREYIRNVLSNPSPEPGDTFFCPSLRHRGTINDFLSLDRFFFDEAYDDDPDAALYDVEQSVEQELDDWISRITNVEEAHAQLEVLMDKYMMKAHTWSEDLEDTVCLSGY